MPPRTRTGATKVLKENIDIVKKSKAKHDGKIVKSSRKALADKTNSLSDDNASIDVPIKTSKKKIGKKGANTIQDDEVRPKRQRRLPPRYVENQTLKNLSNSKDSSIKQFSAMSKTETPTKKSTLKKSPIKDVGNWTSKETKKARATKQLSKHKEVSKKLKKVSKTIDTQVSITEFVKEDEIRPKKSRYVQPVVESPSKDNLNVSSPFKTPLKDAENSLITNRPKRVYRLPSRLEDHSVSPNKFIPVQPCHASTPIIQKTSKITNKTNHNILVENENKVSKVSKPKLSITDTSNSSAKSSPDTNNNGKNKIIRSKRKTVKTILQTKKVSPNFHNKNAKRLLDKSFSFRVLEDKESNEKGDVYEFTFDPDEEPPPQKKKRKKPVKKRPAKPKGIIFKSNYDDNLSKALTNLKSKIKPSQVKTVQNNFNTGKNLETPAGNHDNDVQPAEKQVQTTENHKSVENIEVIENVQSSLSMKLKNNISQSNYNANIMPAVPNESLNPIHASNYASIRVEDIAADFEFHHDDINYSPVTSPHPILNPDQNDINPGIAENDKTVDSIINKDPLNLQDDVSFFEPPIASSSMNISVRQPHAGPWRVEFGSLPMKWHNNTYVKSNMTPAVECSFINSESATKKKHVYTNMLAEPEQLPEIFENPAPALKQTSIISFFKEVAERKANKKKRRRSETRTQGIFEGIIKNTNDGQKSPKKAKLSKDPSNHSNITSDMSTDKENTSNTSNKTPEDLVNKSSEKDKKDKDGTFFGFDESENVDQENISPVKPNPNRKIRALRSRNVLQEVNSQRMPTRALLPVTKAKLASSEVVEQLYDQLKTAEDAQFPEKNAKEPDNIITTNIDPSFCDDNEDSESVHLFEDIELIHHMKPHRKSYGKAKKVTFQRSANSDDSDGQPPVREAESSDDDDLADLSFHLPNVKETRIKRTKKKKPKNLLTKKEEKEVEEWAAGFNSMCENIDEFPLLVE